MPDRRDGTPPVCPREREAVAWLQGELSPGEAEAFARHRAGCPTCERLTRESAPLLAELGRLLSDAPAGQRPGHAAAARALPPRRRAAGHRVLLLRGALAAAGLLLGAFLLADARRAVPENAPSDSVARVHASLRADGTWDDTVHRAPAPDAVGLHALGVLALSASAATAPSGRQNLLAAGGWLLEQQRDDGLLGRPPEEGAFDHPLATLALLAVWEHSGRDVFWHAARRAVERLQVEPAAPGEPAPAGWRTPAQALWELAALLRAQELGVTVSPAHLARQRHAVAREHGAAVARLDARAAEALALARRPAAAERSLGPLFGAAVAVLALEGPGESGLVR